MARTESSSPGIQRLSSLSATLLVAAASALAFGRVFEGAGSTWQLLAVGSLSAALAWLLERRGLLVATTASAAALFVVLGIVAFRETTWYGLPTLETLRQMGDAASAVSEQARIQRAPTPPIDPLVLAGVVAMWAAVFSCHALAFRAGSPLLALVPPVALLAFADTVLEELVRPLYGVAFLVGALAIVFADGLRRTQSWGPVWSGKAGRRNLMGASGRGARRLGAAALAVAAVAPLVVPGFGSTGLVDISAVTGDRLLVDPLVSVASELTREDEVDVLTVATDTPAYLRMFTLPEFDGTTWRLDPADEGSTLSSGTIDPTNVPSGGTTFDQEITVLTDLGFPWLPVAAEPTLVNVGAEVRWSPTTATLTLNDPLEEGRTYRTTSGLVQPAPADVRSVPAAAPSGDDRSYLDLPDDLPPVIEEIALMWTADATTDYGRVLAIQEQLQAFVYDPDVELRDDSQTLARFLVETQRGICQQFASSMAVMLRSIGIPARVAVGFTHGDEDPELDGVFVVGTENLHAWVEVPFEGHGWLAFEPTPGRDNPTAGAYQEPASAATCFRQRCAGGPRGAANRDESRPSTAPNPRDPFPEQEAPSSTDVGGSATADLRRRVLLGAGAVALFVIVAFPSWRWLARRRRLRQARGEPRRFVLATYEVLSQRAADLGAGRGAGETLWEYLRRLGGSDRLGDGHLERLTALTTRAAYSTSPVAPGDALDAEADARAVLRDLRRTSSALRRLAGAYRWR